MGEARSEIVKVRVSSAEKRAVELAARRAGASVSDFVRARLLGEAQGERVGRTGSPAPGRDVESSRDVGGPRPNPREGLPPQSVPASRRATGPRSVVDPSRPTPEVPKIAERWWAK